MQREIYIQQWKISTGNKMFVTLAIHLFSILCLLTVSAKGSFQYAVQVKPVIFILEPESQIVSETTPLKLSCQARIAPLVSNESLPIITWFRNGIQIDTNNEYKININVSIGYSELIIQNTTVNHTGYYQCVVSDANDHYDNTRYHYITLSNKAIIKVITKDVHFITLKLDEPAVLDCGLGEGALWKHNNLTKFDETVHILANGSLVIFTSDDIHAGVWQCYKQFHNHTINGNIYSIEKLSDSYKGIPLVIIDCNNTNPTIGQPVVLSCHTRPWDVINITWYHFSSDHKTLSLIEDIQLYSGDEDDSEDNKTFYIINELSEEDLGYYVCVLILETIDGKIDVLSEEYELKLRALPSINTLPRVTDVYLSSDEKHLELECDVNNDNITQVYWTKNSILLNTTLYNKTTNILNVFKEYVDNGLFGVYQCFAENEFGMDNIVIRVLVEGLSNPPGGLTIDPKTNIDTLLPDVELSWTPPIHRGGQSSLVYTMTYFKTDDLILESEIVYGNSTIVSLSGDGKYTFSLRVKRNVLGHHTTCSVDTNLRFYRDTQSLEFFTCVNGDTSVEWKPPDPEPYKNPAEFVTMNGTCIFNREIKKYEVYFYELDTVYKAQPFVNLSIGTICEFYGKYRLSYIPSNSCNDDDDDTDLYFEIPRETCQVKTVLNDALPADIDLTGLCNISTVYISWNISEDILCSLDPFNTVLEISGICVHKEWNDTFIKEIDLSVNPGGVVTFINIPSGSICSFSGNINNSDYKVLPVQCMLNTIATENSFNKTFYKDPFNCPVDDNLSLANSISSYMETVVSTSNSISNVENYISNNLLSTNSISSYMETIVTTKNSILNVDSYISSTMISKGTTAAKFNSDGNNTAVIVLVILFIFLSTLMSGIITLISFCWFRQRKRIAIMKLEDSEITVQVDPSLYDDNISVKTDIHPIYNNYTIQVTVSETNSVEAKDIYDDSGFVFIDNIFDSKHTSKDIIETKNVTVDNIRCVVMNDGFTCKSTAYQTDTSGGSDYGSETMSSATEQGQDYHECIAQDLAEVEAMKRTSKYLETEQSSTKTLKLHYVSSEHTTPIKDSVFHGGNIHNRENTIQYIRLSGKPSL